MFEHSKYNISMDFSIKNLAVSLILTITFSSIAQNQNVATKAKITASSILSGNTSAENVADGIIGVDGIGEWVCKGIRTSWGYIELPWIQLNWDTPQKINR